MLLLLLLLLPSSSPPPTLLLRCPVRSFVGVADARAPADLDEIVDSAEETAR